MKHLLFYLSLLISSTVLAQPKTDSILSLAQAITYSIEQNFNVKIARNNQDIADINNTWGNAGALPTITANGNLSKAKNDITQKLANGTTIERDGASFQNLNGNVQLAWRVFDGMRMFASKKRLTEIENQGQLAFSQSVNTTVFNTIVQYFNIVRLELQKNALQEVLELNQERERIAAMRFNVGTAAKTDLLQAQVDVKAQQSNMISLENAIAVAKAQLNNVMARNPATPFQVSLENNNKSIPPFDYYLQKLNTNNFDLLIAQSNLAILLQSKKEINSLRLPSLNLTGTYNFQRSNNSAGFTLLNQQTGPQGGIGLSIPIFQGDNVRRQLKVADKEIANQQLTIAQAKIQLETALQNAYTTYLNATRTVALEEENLKLVEENNFISTERFKKSAITSIELRQAQLNFVDAQQRLTNAQFGVRLAEAELRWLAGELLGTDFVSEK